MLSHITGVCIAFVGPPCGRNEKKLTNCTKYGEICAVCVGLTAEDDNVVVYPLCAMSPKVPDILNNSECFSLHMYVLRFVAKVVLLISSLNKNFNLFYCFRVIKVHVMRPKVCFSEHSLFLALVLNV